MSSNNTRKLTVDQAVFSFLSEDGKRGWRKMTLGIETNAGREILTPKACETRGCVTTLTGVYTQAKIRETATLEVTPANALVLKRRLEYDGSGAVTVRGASCGRLGDGSDGGPVFADNSKWRLRFCHQDNLRTEEYPWCRPEFPYERPLPRTATWFGRQESQAAPYVIYVNDTHTETLIEGQLAQERTRLCWQLAAAPSALFGAYVLSWDCFNGGGVLLRSGETLDLEPVFFQALTHAHPQDALGEYFAECARHTRFNQEKNVLRTQAFYCSWNYGIMRGIDESSLLKTARCIADQLPGIRHFLIDGGWQPKDAEMGPTCATFYLPDEQRYDRGKFPHGMRAMADQIRATGLAPALWWTPAVDLGSKLAREHPDWLARTGEGTTYRIGQFGYLDYSLPEAQAYLHHVLNVMCREWGYTSLKLDFWSQSVEANNIRYARGGTGIQWRDWLLSTIRSYLPEDGFLMTCVATAMGNPFLGKHAHSYRCCIDVGNCATWQEHVNACCWIQGVLAFPSRQMCLMNADGFGISPNFTDAENLHRLTYGFITMGSLEVDGRLEELTPARLEWLRRLTAHIDRGHPVHCPDGQAFTGAPYPSILYVDYPEDSLTYRRGIRKHIALFNWSATPSMVGATFEQLGLHGPVKGRDFWTDDITDFGSEGAIARLDGHAARLFEITHEAKRAKNERSEIQSNRQNQFTQEPL